MAVSSTQWGEKRENIAKYVRRQIGSLAIIQKRVNGWARSLDLIQGLFSCGLKEGRVISLVRRLLGRREKVERILPGSDAA